MEAYTKEVRCAVQRIRMPSGQCQACLSDKSIDKDFMITCEICQSSIHNKHYGRELDEANIPPYDKWRCERCRILIPLALKRQWMQIDRIKCQFCPSDKGILKRVVFNGHQNIWIHPECYTWTYPIIGPKNTKRMQYNIQLPSKPTGKFWIRLQDQKQIPCEICRSQSGYKIKCMYYDCEKFYHCTCAKSIGFIRDLQSMRFQNSQTYIPPYCQEHLQKRINDCILKAKKYKNARDESKASHFTQMQNGYQIQLKHMQKSAKKYHDEEEIRTKMEYPGDKQEIVEDLSFDSNPDSHYSEHSQEFYDFIFDKIYPRPSKPIKKISPKIKPPTFTKITEPIKSPRNFISPPAIGNLLTILPIQLEELQMSKKLTSIQKKSSQPNSKKIKKMQDDSGQEDEGSNSSWKEQSAMVFQDDEQ